MQYISVFITKASNKKNETYSFGVSRQFNNGSNPKQIISGFKKKKKLRPRFYYVQIIIIKKVYICNLYIF